MLGIVVLLLYGFALLVIVAALARVAPTEVDEPAVQLAKREVSRWTRGSLFLVSVAVAALWFLAVVVQDFGRC